MLDTPIGTMPAGTYYVGDLCYVLGDRWDEFCDLTIDDENCKDGVFTMKDGTRFATFGTKYGDGSYHDMDYNEYGVDAGLIGCVLVSDIKDEKALADIKRLGAVHEFSTDFNVYGGRVKLDGSYNPKWEGDIHFGSIVIFTGDEEEYEDEDEYDDEEV